MLHKETQTQPLKTGLTAVQQQEMCLWLLTGGEEGKNHESVVYSWSNPDKKEENGHTAFLSFSQSPEYQAYFSETEEEGMQVHQKSIRKWINKGSFRNTIKQLVELGPGNEKIKKYLSYFGFPKKVLDKIKYRASDVAQSGIETGISDAESANLEIGNSLLGSWNKPGTFDGVEDPFYVSFGGGFVNDFEGLSERIANLRSNSLVHGGKLLFTYASLQFPEDSMMGQEDILKLLALYGSLISYGKPNPYRNKSLRQKAHMLIMKPFEALGFPLDCLKYKVVWFSGKLLLGAEVTKRFTMKVGDNTYVKDPGYFLSLIDSPRPTDDEVIQPTEYGGGEIKILSHKHMRYALVDLPKKKVTEKQVYFSLALVALLGIGSLAYFLGKDMENMRRKKMQEKQTQELKLALGCANDVYFNQLLDEILNDMEVRFGNNITQDQKILLTGKVLDFFSSHQTLLSYGYGGGQGMMYSTDLYTPSMMDQFIAENANLLLSMRLNIVPNNRLLENGEALMNSYYYQGERQEFSQVDIQLSDYVSEGAGVESDGKPFYFTYPCGIKIIDGKPYFVVKRAGADGYMLEQKTPNLHSNSGLCAGDITTKIITRGQAQVFAERIQDFLELRYGDKMVASMNGQDVIASYLIDLQAQGRNLGFLFGTTNDVGDPYRYLRDSPLHDFVLTYLLPVISDKLVNGVDGVYGSLKMYNLDTQKIAVDQQKMVDLSKVLPEVYDFLSVYIPKQLVNHQKGKVKSAIMKQLLLDPDVSKLDITDTQSIRAWLTIHAKQFNDDGIHVPGFPDRIDKFLAEQSRSGPTYSTSDKLQGISGKDAHAGGYEQIQFGPYTDIDGNEYDVGVYQVRFLKYKVVARVNNQFSDEDLFLRWEKGELGEVAIETPRGNIPFINKSDALLMKLRDKAITYSSVTVHRLMTDYQNLKVAMEKFKK